MLRTADDAAAPAAIPRPAARPLAYAGWRVALADGRPAVDKLLALADRYRWWLYAAVAVFYAAAFNGQWRVQPDAALYLSIGRNLAEGHGYTYLGHTNPLAYPGWPLMIAAAFRVFGSRSLVPIDGLMLAVAAATLAATYRLVLLHAGRPTAVIVTVGTALTKSFFVYALELWSDLPFAMAAMALLAGYEGTLARRRSDAPPRPARWYDWALLVAGLVGAMAIRPTAWPLLLAVALAMAFDAARGRLRWGTLAAVACVAVVLAAAFWAVDPRRNGTDLLGGTYEQYLLNRMAGVVTPLDRPMTEKVYGLFAWAASDVLFQVRFGVVANSILGVVVLALGFGLFACRALWGLWFTLLLATILLMVQEVLDRYFLPVLPLLVYAWWSALAWVDRRPVRGRRARWAVDGGVLLLLGFGAIANVSKVGGLIGQQRARPFLTAYDRGRYGPVPDLAERVGEVVGPDGIVLVKPPYARVTAFLSRRSVVNAGEVSADVLRGHPVFVIEPADATTTALLDRAGLAVGPAVYTAPPAPAGAAKAEPLSLHPTVRRPPSP